LPTPRRKSIQLRIIGVNNATFEMPIGGRNDAAGGRRWLLLSLSACSVALMQTDNLEKRVQALDARVHELETHQLTAQSSPPLPPAGATVSK